MESGAGFRPKIRQSTLCWPENLRRNQTKPRHTDRRDQSPYTVIRQLNGLSPSVQPREGDLRKIVLGVPKDLLQLWTAFFAACLCLEAVHMGQILHLPPRRVLDGRFRHGDSFGNTLQQTGEAEACKLESPRKVPPVRKCSCGSRHVTSCLRGLGVGALSRGPCHGGDGARNPRESRQPLLPERVVGYFATSRASSVKARSACNSTSTPCCRKSSYAVSGNPIPVLSRFACFRVCPVHSWAFAQEFMISDAFDVKPQAMS